MDCDFYLDATKDAGLKKWCVDKKQTAKKTPLRGNDVFHLLWMRFGYIWTSPTMERHKTVLGYTKLLIRIDSAYSR